MSSSSIASSTPVTVTTCAVFQLPGVKINDAGVTLPSLRSLMSVTVTLAIGLVLSTTLKLSVVPASLVTRPLVGAMLIPRTSLSRLTTLTAVGTSRSYFGSALVDVAVILYVMSSSSIASSTPVTVTLCGVFQLAGVKTIEPALRVPSLVALLARFMVTVAVGWLVSATLKLSVLPDSLVTSPLLGVSTTAAVSLSSIVIDCIPGAPSVAPTGPLSVRISVSASSSIWSSVIVKRALVLSAPAGMVRVPAASV